MMLFRGAITLVVALLLQVASLALGGYSSSAIDAALEKRCLAIGNFEDLRHRPDTANELRNRIWPTVLDCVPFVSDQVGAKQMGSSFASGLPNFVAQVIATRRAGIVDDSECLIKSAASVVPELIKSLPIVKTEFDKRRNAMGPLVYTYSQKDLHDGLSKLCANALDVYGDFVPYYGVLSEIVNTKQLENPLARKVHTIYKQTSIKTSDVLDAAKLCRLYNQGQVDTWEIFFAFLETRATNPTKKEHWQQVASTYSKVFAVTGKAMMQPDESLTAINQLFDDIIFDQVEEPDVDFEPILRQLKRLGMAALENEQSCAVDKLQELRSLANKYGESKQINVQLFVSEQLKRQAQLCQNSLLPAEEDSGLLG